MDLQTNWGNPQVAQDFIDSVIYINIIIDETQANNLGLDDQVTTEADMGGPDINTDGDQTDVVSAQLLNASNVTTNYKDTGGNAIAPSVTHVSTNPAITNYLTISNPTNDFNIYYKAGDSFTMPVAPSVSGYTISNTPANIASLNVGNSTVDYIYTATQSDNDELDIDSNPNAVKDSMGLDDGLANTGENTWFIKLLAIGLLLGGIGGVWYFGWIRKK